MVLQDLSEIIKQSEYEKNVNLMLREKNITEQNTSFFKNSFGKIKADYIRLRYKQKKIDIKEIAFLQVQEEVDKTINYIALFIGTFFGMGAFFNNRTAFLFMLFSIGSILSLLISAFYKKTNCFVQIVFFRDAQIVIKINKYQQKAALEFIKKLAIYRNQFKI